MARTTLIIAGLIWLAVIVAWLAVCVADGNRRLDQVLKYPNVTDRFAPPSAGSNQAPKRAQPQRIRQHEGSRHGGRAAS